MKLICTASVSSGVTSLLWRPQELRRPIRYNPDSRWDKTIFNVTPLLTDAVAVKTTARRLALILSAYTDNVFRKPARPTRTKARPADEG